MTTLYETDFVEWSEKQVQLLRAEEFEKVDWNHVIEEIESLGISQQRELNSRLVKLLMHLLKWQFQESHRSRSWEATIVHQRGEIEWLLDHNPSLRARLSEFVAKAYRSAIREAAAETGLPRSTFPTVCSYTLEKIIDDEFLP